MQRTIMSKEKETNPNLPPVAANQDFADILAKVLRNIFTIIGLVLVIIFVINLLAHTLFKRHFFTERWYIFSFSSYPKKPEAPGSSRKVKYEQKSGPQYNDLIDVDPPLAGQNVKYYKNDRGTYYVDKGVKVYTLQTDASQASF